MNDITHLIMCNVDSLENEMLSSDYIYFMRCAWQVLSHNSMWLVNICQFGVKYCPNPSNGFHTLEDAARDDPIPTCC